MTADRMDTVNTVNTVQNPTRSPHAAGKNPGTIPEFFDPFEDRTVRASHRISSYSYSVRPGGRYSYSMAV